MKFINPDHLPAVPKSWRATISGRQYRVAWENSWHWNQFYSEVVKMSEANSIPVPSEDEVEAYICRQLPKGWCTGDPNFHRPPTITTRRAGCSSCGRRR